ncbi:MAG: hypothetical protein J6B81_02805 [Spirochaetaceae bacterium]|nr:hypothetical protein [Spirochaetaceae bacterium]
MLSKKIYTVSLFLCIAFFCSCNTKEKVLQAEKLYLQALESYVAKDYQQAKNFSEAAYNLDNKLIQSQLLVAKSLFFMDKEKEALEVCKKLSYEIPEFTEARLWYIRSLIFCDCIEEAISLLQQELALNQSDWRFFYLYSLLAEKKQDYETQLSMLNKAQLALSDGAKVFAQMARIWQELGLEQRASEYLEKETVLYQQTITQGVE